MSQLDSKTCPVCGLELHQPPLPRPPTQPEKPSGDFAYYDCLRCGRYGLTRHAAKNIGRWPEEGVLNPTIFGHALRRMQEASEWPLVDAATAERIIATGRLPTAQEQADNLIRWLGRHLIGPGDDADIGDYGHGAIIGSYSSEAFEFIVNGLLEAGLLKGVGDPNAGRPRVTLTFPGWAKYEELLRGAVSGRNAFMAMPYDNEMLGRIVREHFRQAVAQTGFGLKRLDDDQPAGLIDDRLRVEIQGARFLVADLTHGNPGAYWEAGYAEGLGKPVIYTCEESVFKGKPTHFDTNHHLHVLWKAEDMAPAMERLKATIRATIPEARREDG